MNTACFTGHRPKKLAGYQKESYKEFVPELAEWLYAYATQHQVEQFISGGAQGFDQLAFWAVNMLQKNHPELHIKNILYIPFHGQEKKWKATGCFSQHEYNQMIQMADVIHFCTELTNDDNYKKIIKALDDRNKDMVNHSQRVIALYSIEENRNGMEQGGTANCIAYASRKNIPVDRCLYQITDNKMHITLRQN